MQVSAENFKLKEELARERHANEIYRKSMIAEVEEKVDKGVVFADAARAQREVLEQEINSAILSTTTLPPRPLAAPGIGWNVSISHVSPLSSSKLMIAANN